MAIYHRSRVFLKNFHAAEDAAQNFCTPLYAVNDRLEPYLLGSGVLIDVEATTFLVTAAHVLDENPSSNLYLPGLDLVPLGGPAAKTRAPRGDRTQDSVDIAVVRLADSTTSQLRQVNRISSADIDAGDLPAPQTAYGFTGYPASQNKLRRGKQLRLSSSIVTVIPVPNSRYAEVGAHPLLHFAGDFKREEVVDRNGKRITAPDPHGMSGGGVWRLGSYEEISRRRVKPVLIGIGIEFHKQNRLLLGVRASFVVASLAACFPETARYLPSLPGHLRINVIVA